MYTKAKQREGRKRRVLVLCWVCYTLSYLSRTNLSAVLDQMIAEMGLSLYQAGTIGSAYFWAYALGQLVNGFLAERMNPKRMISIGMLGSAAANIGVGLARGYAPVLALWALNGLLLSMVWAPTFKILTNWYDSREYRKVSVYIQLPTTIGYLLSWGVIRLVAMWLDWRYAFLIPAACTGLFMLVWQLLLRPEPPPELAPGKDALAIAQRVPSESSGPMGLRTLWGLGIGYVGLFALALGLMKESINLWAPTMLSDIGSGYGAVVISGFSVLIPIAGTLGIFASGWLIKRVKNHSAQALTYLFFGVLLCCGGAFLTRAMFIPCVLLVSLAMACLCGIAVVVTSFIPMHFVRFQIGAQLAGGLNALAYLGAGIGGGLSGAVSNRWGWSSLYLLWAVLSALALLCNALWRRSGNAL